jgi:hypothetical protein
MYLFELLRDEAGSDGKLDTLTVNTGATQRSCLNSFGT